MGKAEDVYGGKPFDQAIKFFRQKVNIPTKRWDDLSGTMHAKAFTVAGAMKADLIMDLRGAVDKAISEGTTLAQFRKDFDAIVEKSGWAYKGGRDWRTRVIYGTNLRTAYQAGRHQQMTDPAVVKMRPYWQYRHGGSPNPRLEHLDWNGMVLAHDDPFWGSHYPPNGWGCKCRVVTLSRRDMKKLGKEGPDKAPKIEYREYKDREGNIRKVPKGIDPGWDYNVGEASGLPRTAKTYMEKLRNVPADLGAAMAGELPDAAAEAYAGDVREWITDIQGGNLERAGGTRVVGAMSRNTVEKLNELGASPDNAAITLEQRSVTHLLAEARKGQKALPEELVPEIAFLLQNPKAVVWDSKGKRQALLYVVDVPSKDKAGKIVVRVNFKKGKLVSNAVRSGGSVLPQELKKPGMILLEGKIE